MTGELESLRSLQKRIRDATGADRELDLAICKALGRAPQDAIWEVDENLPPEVAKHYKRGWTTPAYVEHLREYRKGIDAAFAKCCSDVERAAEIKALVKEWDYKNSPPFGDAPNYTTDPDGLGACVALCRAVLPGYAWKIGTCCVSDDAWVVPDFNCPVHGERLKEQFGEIEWGSIWDTGIDIDRRPSGNVCFAFLDAIVSALIAEMETKQLEQASSDHKAVKQQATTL